MQARRSHTYRKSCSHACGFTHRLSCVYTCIHFLGIFSCSGAHTQPHTCRQQWRVQSKQFAKLQGRGSRVVAPELMTWSEWREAYAVTQVCLNKPGSARHGKQGWTTKPAAILLPVAKYCWAHRPRACCASLHTTQGHQCKPMRGRGWGWHRTPSVYVRVCVQEGLKGALELLTAITAA